MEKTIKTELVEYTVTPDGDISDGYHTFDELYKHRMIYNACFLKEIANKYKVQRSKNIVMVNCVLVVVGLLL